ncbi:ferritin-like domain-domain-containing protein, partial [Leucosporidium creatinivorum]
SVFNLALTLEKLESSFYQQALSKFDVSAMVQAGLTETQATIILEQIQIIVIDESTHVSAITGALKAAGATPFDGCSFNFDSALSDPLTFVSVARTLEAVGVSAYLGAAHLITDSILLTAAASIVTIEARHQTLFNVFNGGSAEAQPFDIPLAPQQVLALAGGFLQGCQVSRRPRRLITADGRADASLHSLRISASFPISLFPSPAPAAPPPSPSGPSSSSRRPSSSASR